jgi:hypothetical protein
MAISSCPWRRGLQVGVDRRPVGHASVRDPERHAGGRHRGLGRPSARRRELRRGAEARAPLAHQRVTLLRALVGGTLVSERHLRARPLEPESGARPLEPESGSAEMTLS